MCGRTCLTLAPDQLVCACKYTKKEVKLGPVSPTFRNEFNLGLKLSLPSHNISPGELSAIMVSAKHFDDSADPNDRVILPALWGLVPRWHKGDYKKHGLTTNNARMESIEQSKLYKPVLTKRCVLPVEGFYEWQTVNPDLKSSERPVYFIHMPQDKQVKIEDKSTWTTEDLKLMYIAGLFDVWHDDDGDSLYSFTIVTFESNEYFSWLHHRTPAILETEEQISKWLSTETDQPLKLITHPKNLVWYQVSNAVNSSRNKSENCNKPKSDAPKRNSLLDWMKKRKSDAGDEEDTKEVKKMKDEAGK